MKPVKLLRLHSIDLDLMCKVGDFAEPKEATEAVRSPSMAMKQSDVGGSDLLGAACLKKTQRVKHPCSRIEGSRRFLQCRC